MSSDNFHRDALVKRIRDAMFASDALWATDVDRLAEIAVDAIGLEEPTMSRPTLPCWVCKVEWDNAWGTAETFVCPECLRKYSFPTTVPDGDYEIGDGERYTVRTVLEGDLKPGPGSEKLQEAARKLLIGAGGEPTMSPRDEQCAALTCPCGCGKVVRYWHVADCPDDCNIEFDPKWEMTGPGSFTLPDEDIVQGNQP